jgi:hypothetical protein
MKKTLILISLLTLFIGCNSNEKEEEEQIIYGTRVASSLRMTIKDNVGNNLLDPNNPNSFDIDNIKIFYLINGKKNEYYEEHLHAPKGFKVIQDEFTFEYQFVIFLNNIKTEEFPITYIQWNENDTDTIKALFKYYPNSSSIEQKKIWYNNEVIWDYEITNTNPFFELVK